jgi:hypothetical protein
MLFKQLATTMLLTSLLANSGAAFATPDAANSGKQSQTLVVLQQQAEQREQLKLSEKEGEFYAYISELYKEEQYVRPQSCPLEPKGYGDILKKITAIEMLLNNECLGTEVSTVEKILNGAQGIKDELDKVQSATPSEPQTVDGTQVVNYLNALNSINNLYIKMKCEGQRMSFLNKTAEFVSGIAQLGLLSTNPNGIIFAAAGSAISAILNIIDDMFSKQYEFKYEDERLAFVKINCAFRDLRRDLQKSGLLQTGDAVQRRYVEKVDSLIGSIQGKISKLDSAQGAIEKPFEDEKQSEIGDILAQVSALDANIGRLSGILGKDVGEDNIKMRTSLLELYKFGQEFVANGESAFMQELDKHFFDNVHVVNNVLIFPAQFKVKLQDFLPLNKDDLITRATGLEVKDYKGKAGELQAYLALIQEDLRAYKNKIEADYQTESKGDNESGLSAQQLLAQETSQITSQKSDLEKKMGRLKQIKGRLDNILADEKIVSTDNGSLNILTIMEKYVSVESKFYGDLGKQFMDYVVDEGVKAAKDFTRKIKKFESSHDIEVETAMTQDALGNDVVDYKFIDESKYSYESKKRACQDLRPYLIRFSLANALMNAGYDYIWTNRDLFHADHPKKIFRFFGLISGEPQKYLQYHEKSATRANILINGGTIDMEAFDKYIKGEGLSSKQSKMKKAGEAICLKGSKSSNRFPAKSKKKDRPERTHDPADFSAELDYQVRNLIHSDRRTQGMLMLLVDKYRSKAEYLSLIDNSFSCEKILSEDVNPELNIDGQEDKERISIR